VVVIGAGVAYRRLASREATQATSTQLAPSGITARRAVAVLGFKNLSGQPDVAWLSTALAEMLTTELAAGEHLRTIPAKTSPA
jgi:TolB-like protein